MGHAGSPPPAYGQPQVPTQSFPPQQPASAAPQPMHPQSVSQQHPSQQQMPVAQQVHAAPYPIPLASLHDQPAWVNCPKCHGTQMTRVEYHAGTTTHLWALGLCCCFCLGCIPYCISGLKDAEHHCGQCGCLLATYKRGSGTQVEPSALAGQQGVAAGQQAPQKA